MLKPNGVASDLYKELIAWDKQKQQAVVLGSYFAYYEKMGWMLDKEIDAPKVTGKQITGGKGKNDLAQKLKGKAPQFKLRSSLYGRN